ncbi:peptidase family M1, partial [Oesophagostomum dentatum]
MVEEYSISLESRYKAKFPGIDTSSVSHDYDNALIAIPTVRMIYPGTTYELTISYSGFMFDGPHRGGVVSNHNYYEFNGKQGWIFSTDFENGPGARTLMPCADEPAYKAVVQVTVHHSADMKALSNMMDLGMTIEKDGWAATKFAESPPMSTYLIAICVGHFSSISTISRTGVLASAYSWTGMEKYLEYSLMVMAGTIDFMSTYFDYPYPLKKLGTE